MSLHKYTRGDGTEGTFSRAYTPKETVNYETLVRTEYRLQCGEHCYLLLMLWFLLMVGSMQEAAELNIRVRSSTAFRSWTDMA